MTDYIDTSWSDFKTFVVDRNVAFFSVEDGDVYRLYSYDGSFCIRTQLDKDPSDPTALNEYLTDWHPKRNKKVYNQRLKMCAFQQATTNGTAVLSFVIPPPGRVLYGGFAWFNDWVVGDRMEKAEIVDIDGIIQPAGTVLGTFHEHTLPSGNQGWYIPPSGILEMPSVGGADYGLGGLYIRLTAHTGDGRESTFTCNVRWGNPDEV